MNFLNTKPQEWHMATLANKGSINSTKTQGYCIDVRGCRYYCNDRTMSLGSRDHSCPARFLCPSKRHFVNNTWFEWCGSALQSDFRFLSNGSGTCAKFVGLDDSLSISLCFGSSTTSSLNPSCHYSRPLDSEPCQRFASGPLQDTLRRSLPACLRSPCPRHRSRRRPYPDMIRNVPAW
jgi:hypothetical protein